ncbi:hypothetical protein GCM10009634_40110 [Saccharothrix xinjiangensis]
MPGEQGARRNGKDLWPTATVHQSGQGGEPESIRRLVTDRTRQLPTKDRILVPQHKQLGVLRGIAAQQRRRDGQQLPGRLVQQGHDHPNMLSTR